MYISYIIIVILLCV